MPRALIAGLSGQDGTHLAPYLLESGFGADGVVRSATADDVNPLDHLSLTAHEADLIGTTALRKLVLEVNPDEIDNLAAVSSVMQSSQAPVSTTIVNTLRLVSIVEVTVNPAFIRPVSPVEQVGDTSKARRLRGWMTTMSLEELVVAMVDADLEALDRAGPVS